MVIPLLVMWVSNIWFGSCFDLSIFTRIREFCFRTMSSSCVRIIMLVRFLDESVVTDTIALPSLSIVKMLLGPSASISDSRPRKYLAISWSVGFVGSFLIPDCSNAIRAF